MTVLLDTNALLWFSVGSDALGAQTRAVIAASEQDRTLTFSAVSIWETAMLVRKRRYELDIPVAVWRTQLLDAGLNEAPLDGSAAGLAADIANLHPDPADRFIAATAVHLDALLVTSDRKLLDWVAQDAMVRALDARR
ncbi:MAG: type II toxin-antitoxin system VapC family toxin [Alphaproteobacteria bacterium]|nr:type II toxin-antitoxin system VapC family toxin [Alphaproteobacteria bacterium]